MNKSIIGIIILSVGVLLTTPAIAGYGEKCSGSVCKYSGQGSSKTCSKSKDKGYQCPITAKIMKKAHFFLYNREAIGLTDDQVTQIKAIKHEVGKGIILSAAHMQVFEMDLKQHMHAKPIDQAGLNDMIDKTAAGWGENAKKHIQTYIDIKAVLTDSQMDKAKEIWSSN
ncbi:MAG: hypothetical protein ACI9CF_000159 [Candidatus Omnitrophota bacterium]|jgi:hypothetical protein